MEPLPALAPSRARRGLVPLLALVLLVGASAAGCADGGDHGTMAAPASHGIAAERGSATHGPAAATHGPAAEPPLATPPVVTGADVPMGSMVMPTGEQVSAAWEARPAFVTQLPPDWQAAYAFALARPDVLQWLPCYCGCGGAGHRSNLDCFFQRRETGAIVFEEHGSYCDICIETANLASSMLRQGSTMTQIRDAVDATFSGAAPGTVTPLPPA
jgi:hypothetical protein